MGMMAATHLINAPQDRKIVSGYRRLAISLPRYYTEHAKFSDTHDDDWLHDVIEPLVEKHPSSAADILQGAQLRLATAKQHYDTLLLRLSTRQTR